MDPRWKPTALRVAAGIVGTLLAVILVGGLTETFVGNGVAQWVRKAILIGGAIGISQWVVRAWQSGAGPDQGATG